jgi:hypothetical protein
MRFMSLYKAGFESTEPPTQEHMESMGRLIEEMTKAGSLIETGGLQHSSTGFRVQKVGSQVTVTDGPYTEAKEVIGGYAILEAKNREHAVELARIFLDVVGGGTCDIRPMCQAPELANA